MATLEILILRPGPGRATNQRTDILETAYMEKCPKYSIWRVLDPGEEIVLFVFFHRASRESNLELVFFLALRAKLRLIFRRVSQNETWNLYFFRALRAQYCERKICVFR